MVAYNVSKGKKMQLGRTEAASGANFIERVAEMRNEVEMRPVTTMYRMNRANRAAKNGKIFSKQAVSKSYQCLSDKRIGVCPMDFVLKKKYVVGVCFLQTTFSYLPVSTTCRIGSFWSWI